MTNYTLPESHEAKERQWVLDHVPKGGVFIDVGADTGTWTIPLSKHFELVFAIEPSIDDYTVLQHSLTEKNINNVVVIPAAASDTQGEDLFLSAGNDEPNWFPSLSKPDLPYTKSEVVPTMKIDNLVLSPRLIKIDTEGWGAQVLRGASMTLLRTDFVVLEIHNDHEKRDCIDILQSVSFSACHRSDSGSIWYFRKVVTNNA